MPKQVFKDGKLTIIPDENNPKDKLKSLQKQCKGKDLKLLTNKEKAALFDAYVDVGVIT